MHRRRPGAGAPTGRGARLVAGVALAVVLAVVLAGTVAGVIGLAQGSGDAPATSARPAATHRTVAASTNASATTASNPTATFPPPPACGYEDLAAPLDAYDDVAATPLDTRFAVGSDYEPPDLVSLETVGFDDGRLVRAIVVDDLRALREAAAANGTPIEIQSAYRSYDYQARVFAGWVDQLGRDRALATSARPGHSEHQLGTVVDVRSLGGPAPWDLDDWAETPAGAWMAANAWRYGFVMSYPRAAQDQTCYAYEPWHYRWVGRDVARRVAEAGVPLRTYLWRPGGPLADAWPDPGRRP